MNEWEMKYKALCAGITKRECIDNAKKLVEIAMKLSAASAQPLETTFYTMLQATTHLQAQEHPLRERRESSKTLYPPKDTHNN